MISVEILGPVIALVAWSLVMWIWMYATRIPAMFAANMKLDPNAPRGEQMALLPPEVRWKADNYNHLMEQPTIFYAICFALQFLDQTQPINIGLAWAYVAIRIIHSLVQATVNIIIIRFTIFSIGSLVLMALTFHALIAVGAVNVHLPH